MFSIESSKCTGCGACVEVCPQGAIEVRDKVAVIDQRLCSQCGSCVEICPSGAIRAAELVYAKSERGGGNMYYRYGFGFRGASPPWPYVGRGRGGLPRCWYPGLGGATVPYAAPAPYWTAPTHEQELGFLKTQAEATKRQLEDIERRIQELEKKS